LDIALTVSVVVEKHPVGNVYVIIGLPAATPVAMPLVDPMVANAELALVHAPPLEVLPKVTEVGPLPPHMEVAPVIAAG